MAAPRAWPARQPRCWCAKGARVAILDRPSSKGEEVAAAIGGGTRFYPCDVTDFAGTEAAIARAADDLGAVHFGVNTAGGGIAKRTLTKEGPHPLDAVSRA